MKLNIYILVFGLMVSACTTSEDKTRIISVLEDTTEIDFIAKPDATTIQNYYNFDTNLWQSANFRFGRINSLMHNTRQQVGIPSEQALLGNELERQELVTGFQDDIENILQKSKETKGHKYSSIWLPLVKELKVLQKTANSNTTVYLFSDLQENSRFFSVFRVADLQLLEGEQEKVLALFLEKSKGIQPTDTIEVVVVFQPQTIDQDERFQKLKHLYAQLFSKLGIRIKFVANLN
ncbi:hypothetical protein [Polaribacter cellanae]|uniref:Lipoprotein n=1 Tax=Polaribacter cellanae TaxID=2818493 RepID=A0A975CKW6_9FLAO|nr:hypothetical protein [Polaribacter cellanae]QTE21115.1 hypothetical protein J3359_09655 [Polaribacter cellanae]